MWQVWAAQMGLLGQPGCCHSLITLCWVNFFRGWACPRLGCLAVPSHSHQAGHWGAPQEDPLLPASFPSLGWVWREKAGISVPAQQEGRLAGWRRRLGGAGFPAIVGEAFLLCSDHGCLAVKEAGSTGTGLLGRRKLLPLSCQHHPRGQHSPCLRSHAPARRRRRAGCSGGYPCGGFLPANAWGGGLPLQVIWEIFLKVFSSHKGGVEFWSVAVTNFVFSTGNSGEKRGTFSSEYLSSCVFKWGFVVVLLSWN